MSYYRAKNRSINKNVLFDNRTTRFLSPPIHTGDLYVDRNETVGGDMDICGNLTVGQDLRARSYYANGGNFYLDNYLLIPYGTIIQSAAINVPDGWLDCNGSLKLRTQYVNLYNAIGYTYSGGVYSGSDLSFNVPDIRGRVAVGSGTGSGLTARTLGATGGAETHTLTVGEMPSHDHTSNANGGGSPGALGLISITGSNTQNAEVNGGNEPDLYANPVALDINNTGGGSAHNNMQPYIVFRYLIKY